MNSALYTVAERTRIRAYPVVNLTSLAVTRTVRVVAEGDSWFSYFPAYDILATLRRRVWGGRIYDIKGSPRAGSYLNDIVYQPRQVADILEAIHRHQPEVFLFSGGGNDIAGPELFDFLWHQLAGRGPVGATRIINNNVVQGVIGDVFDQAYRDYIGVIQRAAREAGIQTLPIIVHGYAYAIPDGRGWAGGFGPLPGPWLDPSLSRKGWDRTQHLQIRRQAIGILIDAFNTMLANLATNIPDLHYVDLRPILQDEDWGNELHPNERGFAKISEVIEAVMRQVVP